MSLQQLKVQLELFPYSAPFCADCHSDKIEREAKVEWHKETQKWVVCELGFQEYCIDCDGLTDLIWANIL